MALRIILITLVFSLLHAPLIAKEKEGIESQRPSVSSKRLKERCIQASAQADLNVNNIRARILNGGDMWWDLVGSPKYEIPKVPAGSNEVRRHSLFAASIWIGGLDNGNVVGAAQTYRQGGGNEFWPGPIDTTSITVDRNDCNHWDQVFQVTRDEINQFIADFEESGGQASVPENIKNWPGNGRRSGNESRFMAPYVNVGGGPGYDPSDGDYPDVRGDQAHWFVYNDVGNLKTQTRSPNIGLEFRTMAFAFATNDEINNMTFYETTIFNKGNVQLDETYFGQWVDADLGYFNDDYVGCDTNRGLGFCYNGDNFDETATGYGANPPSVGVDFFRGPSADLEMAFDGDVGDGIDNDGDGLIDEQDTTFYKELRAMGYTEMPLVYEGDGFDNNRNGIKDEPNEDITMSKFVFFNNTSGNTGDPDRGNMVHYYNYLTGRWKNGDCLTYGGNGTQDGPCANFMFPGDPTNLDEWSELNANNPAGDRRFVQSAGPFTLKPGAVNKLTVGVVWARASSGGNTGSFKQLLIADDKAQRLFNNGFEILDGPDAPELSEVELDRELIFIMDSEDYMDAEEYVGTEYTTEGQPLEYRFQGYRLFQLANAEVSLDQLDNSDLARQVWQSDIEDGISNLVNVRYDPEVEDNIPILKVSGSDNGIGHVMHITDDAFSSGNSKLINHKVYHYLLVSYAALGVEQGDEDIQYLEGRRTTRISAMPHKTEILFDGVHLNTAFGEGPEITCVEGAGNGGIFTLLTPETVDTILTLGKDLTPTYQRAAGPVKVEVINPLKVPVGDFELRMIDKSVENTHESDLSLSLEVSQKAVNEYTDSVRVTSIDLEKKQAEFNAILDTLSTQRDSVSALGKLLNDSNTTPEDSIWYASIQVLIKQRLVDLGRDTLSTKQDMNKLSQELERHERRLNTLTNRFEGLKENADACYWELTKIAPNGLREVVKSERPIYTQTQTIIERWGLSVQVQPVFGPISEEENTTNGFVDASLNYEDDGLQWLSALPHIENPSDEFAYPLDWIRSGSKGALASTPNSAVHDAIFDDIILDAKGAYRDVLNGMVAPYVLTSRTTTDNSGQSTFGLSAGHGYGVEYKNFAKLSGIDLVFTNDRNLWTKVPVVEMGENTELTEGGAQKFHLRRHASLLLEPGANGEPQYDESSTGFSWFPGYAVNVETGERLNIIIGENTVLDDPNARDMVWNPSSKLQNPNIPITSDGGLVAGGMHYIYVMDAHSVYTIGNGDYETIYDEGKQYAQYLDPGSSQYSSNRLKGVWASCAWVMPAMLEEGYELKSWKDGLVPTQTSLRIRVNKPYQTYARNETPRNGNLPFYTFNTENIAPTIDEALGKSALQNIRVVPNPYYAQSAYEGSPLDNTVKITKLPKNCHVKIYTVNGALVKSFQKAESEDDHNVELKWNLKNEAGVDIASGVYIIHIDAAGLGTTTVKLFAIMRPVDLDTF